MRLTPRGQAYLLVTVAAVALVLASSGCPTTPNPPETPGLPSQATASATAQRVVTLSGIVKAPAASETTVLPATIATTSTAPIVPAMPNSTVPAATATPTPMPATPVPPPPTTTPTPRAKPPPSPYKTLQDYPRPAGDSGYGFHINGQPFFPSKDVLPSQVIPLLKALGATWVTVWASSYADDQVEPAKLLVDSGFEVILRLHELKAPHPDYVPSEEALRRFRAAGIRYFVTGNEPNLILENPGRAGPDAVARQWMLSADRVKAAGGIPLLYPMSPGGGGDVADNRTMLLGMLDWLKANDALDTLDGAGVAIHNRPLGKPLEVLDSTSFLEYEWIDDTVARYAGKHIPLFGTEAGYAFGEQVVPAYPRVDGDLHKQYNLAIIHGFRDGRWRDTLFTQNFWILSGFGYREFIADWWVANPVNFGKDLPIVESLKAMPKFQRKFSAPGFH